MFGKFNQRGITCIYFKMSSAESFSQGAKQ